MYRNPNEMTGQVLDLIRRYNVMSYEQICVFFPGAEKAAGRACRKLEKNRQIVRNPYTGLYASSEFAYSLKDDGTMLCLWVLADMLGKKRAEGHYLAEKEDYPARIIFFSSQEIYDILYVGAGDLKLVNGLYAKGKRQGENHIVVVEDGEMIGQIEIPNVIGFCVVQEGGVEYYRDSKSRGENERK